MDVSAFSKFLPESEDERLQVGFRIVQDAYKSRVLSLESEVKNLKIVSVGAHLRRRLEHRLLYFVENQVCGVVCCVLCVVCCVCVCVCVCVYVDTQLTKL